MSESKKSTRVLPRVTSSSCDKERVYLDKSLPGKSLPFKAAYSIGEFETLVKEKEYQEAYWAATLLQRLGAQLENNILNDVRLAIEVHWPDIREEKDSLQQKIIYIMKEIRSQSLI